MLVWWPILSESSVFIPAEYELQRSQNRVKILEEELRLVSRGGELAAHISGSFNLKSVQQLPNGAVTVNIVSQHPRTAEAMCQAGAQHVFHIGLYDISSGAPISAGLLAGCPAEEKALHATVPGLWLTSALPTRLQACAMVELFNADGGQLNASDGTACRRLAIPLGARFGCINFTRSYSNGVGAQSHGSARGGAPCRHAASSTPGAWFKGPPLPGSRWPAFAWQPALCKLRSGGDTARIKVATHRWLRVLGDSVTHSLASAIGQAFAPRWAFKGPSASEADPGGGPPKWSCRCTKSGRCVSFEKFFDVWGSSALDIPSTPKRHGLTDFVANMSNKAHTQLSPSVTYISLGSHDVMSGGDETYAQRLHKGFRRFLQSAGAHAHVILATSTAWAVGSEVPAKFLKLGARCLATNFRVQMRNQVAAQAFLSACASTQVCQVIDLFSPTLPWIHPDQGVYTRGDPVHFHGHLQATHKCHWADRLIADALLY